MQTFAKPCSIAEPAVAHKNVASVASRITLFAFVFAAACVMFFSELGTYPLFNPDESLYAEPAREMLVTGEYVTTLLNYVVRYTKPPLCIWAMAGAYKIFGVNEFAARFFGAACGAILVAITYLALERYANRRAALIGSTALITAPLFIGTAREAITDMPLSLFIGGALLAFFHARTQNKGAWRWVGYVLIGLAVMTKGPVGLILPVAILGAYHFLKGDIPSALKFYNPIAGLLIVAAIAVPWFAVEIYVTKGAYYYEFLVRENFQRFTSVVDHKGAWWYHIAAVAGGFLPWSVFVLQALLAATKLPARRESFHYGLFRFADERQSLRLFSALWFVITLAFFSASVSKLLPYTVPAFAALAIVVASYLDEAIAERAGKRIAVPLAVLAVVFGIAVAIAPNAIAHLRESPPALPRVVQGALLSLMAAGAVGGFLAWQKRTALAVGSFSAVLAVSMLVFGGQALAIISQQWEGPIPTFAYFAGMSDWPILVWHMRKPSIPFYAGRRVEIPMTPEEMTNRLSQTDGAYVIGKKADMALLSTLPRTRVVSQKGLFVLLAQQPKSRLH